MAGAYIATTPFPNTTTLYGWAINGGSDVTPIPNVFGGIDLTRTGALSSATDHLGASTFCDFDGTNDWLSSSNAAFNFTASFSFGGWFYIDNFSDSRVLVARLSSGSNGWWSYYDTGPVVAFETFSGGVSTSLHTSPTLSVSAATWFHVVFTRTANTNTKIYINGSLISTDSDTSENITAGGNLEIGSNTGGSNKLNGRAQDVFIHKDTVLADDDVNRIYKWGAGVYHVI